MQRARNYSSERRSPIRRSTPLPPVARRQSPRPRQTSLLRYGATRIDEPIANPIRSPRTPAIQRVVVEDSQDEDVPMVDENTQTQEASQATSIVSNTAGDPESPSRG